MKYVIKTKADVGVVEFNEEHNRYYLATDKKGYEFNNKIIAMMVMSDLSESWGLKMDLVSYD